MKLYNVNMFYTKVKHVTFTVSAATSLEATDSVLKGAYISACNDTESDWHPVISTAKVCESVDAAFEAAKAEANTVKVVI